MQLLGAGPMFIVSSMDFGIPRTLAFYLILGGVCGLAAVGFSRWLYWTEDQFEKLPIDELWWPAIGALGLGIIGYFVPRVLGVGYDTISDILNANLGLKLLIIVMIAKAVALVVSLGSGTSGGCAHAGGYVSNRTMKPMCCIRLWWRKPWIAMFQLCPQACELESWQSALQHMIRW
jgi:H+/Cl- antiporter ClcA